MSDTGLWMEMSQKLQCLASRGRPLVTALESTIAEEVFESFSVGQKFDLGTKTKC